MDSKMQRRTFLKETAVAAAGVTILPAATVFGTAANSVLNMGVIGCGGRGTAVSTSFVANTETRLAAAADLFKDRLMAAQTNFNKANAAKGRAAIEESNLFLGSQGYLRLLDRKDVDFVLVSSPPFLHPEHLEAVVQSGKHVYCEKPVGVDVRGCKRVIAAGKKVGTKQTLAVGFQIRHASPYVAMVQKIHGGAIGDIATVQACYLAGTVRLPQFPNASPEELRLRHWLNYQALSGDILVEQGIHVVDICNWALKGHPVKAMGSNGRVGRKDQGDSSSYFVVNYIYPNNVNVAFQSTQFDPGLGDVFERFFGTNGIAEAHYTGGVFIKGPTPWDSGVARGSQQEISAKDWATGTFKSALEDADPNKQKAVVDSIKTGKYINEAEAGAESALTAILGRTAAYTGKVVTWDEMLASDAAFDPKVNLKQFDS